MAIDAKKINYPNVDSARIFNFIDEVQSQSANNALVPFSDFEELQSYLRQQWASLLFRFLLNEGEAKRTRELVSSLATATKNIEFLTRQVVQSIGDPIARTAVEFYDYLLGFEVTRDLSYWRLTPSPRAILMHETIDEFCKHQIEISDADEEEYGSYTITAGGPPYKLGKGKYQSDRKQYAHVRNELLKRLEAKGIALDSFIQAESTDT